MIEDKKKEFNISEYSVTSTSLEQIFQTFANQSTADKAQFTYKMNALGAMVCQNPDGKSTISQQRLAARGFRHGAHKTGTWNAENDKLLAQAQKRN